MPNLHAYFAFLPQLWASHNVSSQIHGDNKIVVIIHNSNEKCEQTF